MTMTEDDEKRVPTLGGATVALEDIFSGRIVAERNVFAIGEHGLLVILCVDHRRREVETVAFFHHGSHRQVVESCQRLDLKAETIFVL